MNKLIFTAAVAALACATSACSKKDMTPGEVAKTFLTDFATDNVDDATARLMPPLKAQFLAKPDVTKSAFAEQRLRIEKCGGYKEITSFFDVRPEQTGVEGYSYVEYKGQCPAEKQYLRLKKSDTSWLIEEVGPRVKP